MSAGDRPGSGGRHPGAGRLGLRRRWAVAVPLVALIAGPGGVAGFAGTASASNDTYFSRQWALTQIRAPQAWAKSTGAGITIGIVDTGIDLGHPDLAGKVAASANCVAHACVLGGAQDDHGHGTIVSGIAAAVTNNARGIAGVAPDARLVVAKVLDSTGTGRVDDINNGIRWVVDNGAKVVNLSLGDPNVGVTNALGSPLRTGIEYAWSKGAVPVLASGNYATSTDLGSENYGSLDALVVGATDRTGAVPAYSSAPGNAKWGLVAPGGAGTGSADDNVISTYPLSLGGTGYVSAAGTSMAAPQVSGAVALLLAEGLTPTAAVSRLLATLNTATPCGRGCQGRLDVGAAVGIDPSATTSTVAPPPTTRPTVPRTTVPKTTTTTKPKVEVPASTTTSTTVAPRSVQAADPPQAALPVPLVGILPPKPSRNPWVPATATVLVFVVGGAVGGTGLRRLRAA